MDMGCFDETVEPCFSDQETSKKLGSGPAAAAANDQPTPSSRSASSCFDCSICLDFPVDPAVTLCGHLYCWPCIYKWMTQSKSAASSPHTYCPVCKAPLSENALVPLYGRGCGGGGPRKNNHLDVPKRPNVRRDAIGASMIIDERRRNGGDADGYITSSVFSSTAGGVLGGLAVAVQPLLMARRPYRLSSPSPRERRREVLVEESLHQIWVFLLCAAVLCLLFF